AAQTPSLRILLPEHTRLLQKQLIDIVIEVRNAPSVSNLRVTAGSVDLTSKFGAPVKTQLDCDDSIDWVIRADLQSFDTAAVVKLEVALSAGGTPLADSRSILVRPFSFPSAQRRNIILFIGDAMGTAYRDAARLVYRAIVDANEINSF